MARYKYPWWGARPSAVNPHVPDQGETYDVYSDPLPSTLTDRLISADQLAKMWWRLSTLSLSFTFYVSSKNSFADGRSTTFSTTQAIEITFDDDPSVWPRFPTVDPDQSIIEDADEVIEFSELLSASGYWFEPQNIRNSFDRVWLIRNDRPTLDDPFKNLGWSWSGARLARAYSVAREGFDGEESSAWLDFEIDPQRQAGPLDEKVIRLTSGDVIIPLAIYAQYVKSDSFTEPDSYTLGKSGSTVTFAGSDNYKDSYIHTWSISVAAEIDSYTFRPLTIDGSPPPAGED